MAGAGAKKFPAFSKLTSDDVNDYLADQVIMRFATTAARDAAFGGVGEPTLAEGMTAYIDADNSIYTYDGSNWVKMVSASQPVGLSLIAKFTATSGLAVACNDVFSAEYDNYLVLISEARTTGVTQWNFTLNGATTGYYWSGVVATMNQVVTGQGEANGTSVQMGVLATQSSACKIEFFQPFINTETFFNASGTDARTGAATAPYNTANGFLTSSSRTGFTLNTGVAFTNIVVTIYGYRKG